MLNIVWVAMLIAGVLAAAVQGDIGIVASAATAGAGKAVELVISLAGGMMLWLGLLALLRESGMIGAMARLLSPVLGRLFPDLDKEGEAFGSIVLNFGANLLGLGNAATPFGIKAIGELNRLNPTQGRATDDMITLLLLNTTAPTLLPTTIIALRAAKGSANPTEVVPICFLASTFGLLVGLLAHKMLKTKL